MSSATETAPVERSVHASEFERVLLTAVGLFLLALIPRCYVAEALRAPAPWDGHYYEFYARRIASGFGYTDPMVVGGVDYGHASCHYPVGYSAVLGLVYKLFGVRLSAAAAFNAVVGAALAVVTERIASFAIGRTRAIFAGLLVALHPGLILYSALIMSEPLAALGTLAAFWLFLSERRRGHLVRGAVLSALLLGASALVRPQALLCAPLFTPVVWEHWRRGGASRSVRGLVHTASKMVAICLLALLPVLPWTVRNCRAMDGCALVSTNGGWNLAIGAFPRATGRFEGLRSTDGCSDVTGQVNQDRCWFAYGVAQIRAHPGRWLALIPKKLGYTFDHESFAVEYLHEARDELWPEPRRADARGVLSTTHRMLLLLGCLAGVGVGREGLGSSVMRGTQMLVLTLVLGLAWYSLSREQPLGWPLAIVAMVLPLLPLPGAPPRNLAMVMALGLVASVVVTHAVFFGEDRYHLVATPVFCMLSAGMFRSSWVLRASHQKTS
jgi:4-amino-4-deoxy-L-arabinose transferase-like glycosyltransferase